MTMLEGKKLLITGVVTKQSIAFAVAEQPSATAPRCC